MNKDIYNRGLIYGIRRGNTALVKTSFDALWDEGRGEPRLRHKLIQAIIENSWPLLYEFFKRAPEGYSGLLKLYLTLALTDKSKDAHALAGLYSLGADPFDEDGELRSMVELEFAHSGVYMKIADKYGFFQATREISEFFDWMFARNPIPEETINVINKLKAHAAGGGTLEWKRQCLTAMILIARRGLDDISGELEAQLSKRRDNASYDSVPIPWYCFDVNTEEGRKKLSKLKSGKTASILWLLYEGELVEPSQLRLKERVLHFQPSPWDSIWWKDYIELRAMKLKCGFKEWNKIRSKVKAQWLKNKMGRKKAK